MTPQTIDLTDLPESAREEVLDFYEFVKARSLIKSGQFASRQLPSDWRAEISPCEKPGTREEILDDLVPRKGPDFIPLKRDDIYDR